LRIGGTRCLALELVYTNATGVFNTTDFINFVRVLTFAAFQVEMNTLPKPEL
jgi:hypothetical protein